MITNFRQHRSPRTVPMQGAIRNRLSNVTGIRDDAESTRDTRDRLALKLPLLEAEVLGLQQTLAEVKANHDALRKEMGDLRRDRDHWRKLAEPSEPKLATGTQKTWFCGRVSAAAQI